MKSSCDSLRFEMRNLERAVYELNSKPASFPDISKKEREKRSQKVNELKEKADMIQN